MPSYGTYARIHQANFRASSPIISRQARSPSDDKGKRHGHLLAQGCELYNLIPVLRGD